MGKYIKLPNGTIAAADDNNFIVVNVSIDLSQFIDNDLEGVLDLLSEEATGTPLLSNISYSIVDHCADTLDLKVSGSIEMIDDIEEVCLESLPMAEFVVEVTRIGFGNRTVRLSARTAEEARDIADDDAGNHSYQEHVSKYEFDVRKVEA